MKILEKAMMVSIRKKILVALFTLSLVVGLGLFSTVVEAQGGCSDPNDILGIDCGGATGLTIEDPRVVTVRIINFILTFLGIIAFVLILYAGFMWMTSAGNEDKVATAKKILVSAVVGLTIILVSYTITSYILRALCISTGSCGTPLF
jgi:phage shock protein PspC (stress-responsive transcriptional regulator)